MVINCYRCGKPIDTPDSRNADYILAQDTVVKEMREILVVKKHNAATMEASKYPELQIDDSEYDEVEVDSFDQVRDLEFVVKVLPKEVEQNIQKSGIICPSCYRDTDFVIWGVHKK